ncbi:MAG: methylated-DNA--[protein]-cysteine S-methyltransferase [Ginsengibacter sp.]|jgi:methylated-DNA-[protein]-cysteine S-methyltransferase
MFTIYYSSPIGMLKIIATETHIQEIIFMDDKEALNTKKISTSENAILKKCKKELDQYFKGKRKQFSVSIHQEGTPFQEKVWNELLNIPFGKTVSYAHISEAIQNKKAVRAVGTANGSNHLPIIVPCHRVIGANGKLTGYGGGIWRKQWLIEHELTHSKNNGLLF